MGYAGNFENSLRKTSGDIIFLCDQDDIWVKNKVELTIKAFDSNPNVHLIVSDAFLMDGHGNKIDEPFYHPLSGDSHFVFIDGYRDYPPFYTLKIYGMTMCFKKTLLHEAIPFPKSTISHDRWIAFCAMTLHNGFYYLSDKLVYYRIHGSNASMSSETSTRKKFAKICRVIYITPYDMTNISTKMMHILEKTNLADTKAYSETNDILYNYKQQAKSYESSIFKGISIILNLKKSNKWYAIDGSKYFLAQIYIIIFGRRYMKKTSENCTISTDILY